MSAPYSNTLSRCIPEKHKLFYFTILPTISRSGWENVLKDPNSPFVPELLGTYFVLLISLHIFQQKLFRHFFLFWLAQAENNPLFHLMLDNRYKNLRKFHIIYLLPLQNHHNHLHNKNQMHLLGPEVLSYSEVYKSNYHLFCFHYCKEAYYNT